MQKIDVDNKTREQARDIIVTLPRNQKFILDILSDQRKVFICTDGTKTSMVNGREIQNIDITIHYDGELKPVNYVDDIIVDIVKKFVVIKRENVKILLEAIKESIELKPLTDIFKNFPELKSLEKLELPGHSIELILALAKAMGLQEDVNYWGINPKTKKPYEGRYKPYNVLNDLFFGNTYAKNSLKTVLKKHRLINLFDFL